MKTKQLLFLLPAICILACSSKHGAPRLTIPAAVVDMGVIQFDSSHTIEYKLVNSGNAMLVIDTATASCGCTVPVIAAKQIGPGSTGMMTVQFKPVDTGYFDKRVVIKSNTDSSFSVVSFKGRAVKGE